MIREFEKKIDDLGIIDLLLLEDLQNIEAIGYNKTQKKLRDDIFKMAIDIQSRHKNQNNDEDQYNNLFQALLSFSGYIAHDQAQRGTTTSGKRPGELDIQILTRQNLPLSIFEAFVIKGINSNAITTHLKKLSENYDPNGLQNNYAVIYAKNKDFESFWSQYRDFVPTIDFQHPLTRKQVEDVTNRFPKFAGMKVGVTVHNNRGSKVQVYHIFMDMYF